MGASSFFKSDKYWCGVYSRAAFIRRNTVISLYKTLVRPLLEYNSIIWSSYSREYNDKIENIQMKMLRYVETRPIRSLSYQEKLKRNKLLTLSARRIKHQLLFLFKLKNNRVNLPFDDFFQINPSKKTRGNVHKLYIPKTKTKLYQNFFSSSVIKHWNKLKSKEI